jgi:hypothetical protein
MRTLTGQRCPVIELAISMAAIGTLVPAGF